MESIFPAQNQLKIGFNIQGNSTLQKFYLSICPFLCLDQS